MPGPREWSPRLKWVWVLLKDTPNGYEVEVFRTEQDAYVYAAGSMLPWVWNRFDDEEKEQFKKLSDEKKYEDAFDFYHEILDASALKKMPYYSVIERELL